jgi:uncharacterized protein (UPF0303 family)
MSSDLDGIARQERELRLSAFTPDIAWTLGTRLRELGVARGHNLLIDISRIDYQLFCCAVGETTADNAEWVRRKRNIVRRFQRSSSSVGLALEEKGKTLNEQYGLDSKDYVTHGGAFPVHIHGCGFVGSITVSGLPQRLDHELVVEVLCAELGRPYEDYALSQPG